jgi:hypothetical protein
MIIPLIRAHDLGFSLIFMADWISLIFLGFVIVRLVPEDEDKDGLRNIGLLTAQPFDPPDSPRELHHTQSPGKQQISLKLMLSHHPYNPYFTPSYLYLSHPHYMEEN